MPTNHKSKIYAVVGEIGMGKSHFIESKIKEHGAENFFCFDPHREYPEICSMGKFNGLGEIGDDEFHSIDDFAKTVYQRIRGKHVVMEEATSYYRGKDKNAGYAEEIMQNARHHKNDLYLCFHDLRFPLWVFTHANRVILFRTSDLPKNVEIKFKNYPQLVEAHYRMHELDPNLKYGEKGSAVGVYEEVFLKGTKHESR